MSSMCCSVRAGGRSRVRGPRREWQARRPAELVFHDSADRVYPSLARRLAPDFSSTTRCIATAASTVLLPPGTYEVSYGRGPEYHELDSDDHGARPRRRTKSLSISKRWINLADSRLVFGRSSHPRRRLCPLRIAGRRRPAGRHDAAHPGRRPERRLRPVVGALLVLPKTIFRRQSPQALDARQLDALRRRSLGLSQLARRPLVPAAAERRRLPRHHRASKNGPVGTCPFCNGANARGPWSASRTSGWGLQVDGQQACRLTTCRRSTASAPTNTSSTCPRRLRLYLGRRHAGHLGTEHLVPHAQLRLHRPDQRRDRFSLHLWRTGRPGPRRMSNSTKDQPLDYDAWVDGLRDGRSYVPTASHLFDSLSTAWASASPAPAAGASVLAAEAGKPLVVRSKPRPCWPTSRATTFARRRWTRNPIGTSNGPGSARRGKVPVELIVNGRVGRNAKIMADGSVQDAYVSTSRPTIRAGSPCGFFPAATRTPSSSKSTANRSGPAARAPSGASTRSTSAGRQKSKQIRPAELPAAEAAYEHARQAYRKVLAEATGP